MVTPDTECELDARATPRPQARSPNRAQGAHACFHTCTLVPVYREVSTCAGSRRTACRLRISQSLWGSRGSARSMGQLDFISCLLKASNKAPEAAPSHPPHKGLSRRRHAWGH